MILKAGFHFSVSFLSPFFCFSVSFLSPFLLFHEDDQSFSPAPDVFPIYLFVYLFMYFYSPATAPSSWSLSSLSHSQASLEKTLRLGRNCLLRSRYIGCEAPSFLPGVLHRHSQFNTSKVIETDFRSSPDVGDTSSKSIMPPFFVSMVYAIRKRKVERSLRGTQDYVSTLRIVDT